MVVMMIMIVVMIVVVIVVMVVFGAGHGNLRVRGVNALCDGPRKRMIQYPPSREA
jgi:hypothetical protein